MSSYHPNNLDILDDPSEAPSPASKSRELLATIDDLHHGSGGGSNADNGTNTTNTSPNYSSTSKTTLSSCSLTETITSPLTPSLSFINREQEDWPLVMDGLVAIITNKENTPLIKNRAIFEIMSLMSMKPEMAPSTSLSSLSSSTTTHPIAEVAQTTTNTAIHTLHFYDKIFNTVIPSILWTPLPPRSNPFGDQWATDDDDPQEDDHWSTLRAPTWSLLLMLLESPDLLHATAREAIASNHFIHSLFHRFDSEDPREREAAKTILHRIYGKFLPLRSSIRTKIREIFLEFIVEERTIMLTDFSESVVVDDDDGDDGSLHLFTTKTAAVIPALLPHITCFHNIAEILEIFASIINGFAIPLRAEHLEFLHSYLIPLLKSKHLPSFHSQLSLCILQYAEKDPSLVAPLVTAIIPLYSRTSSTKQCIVLLLMEELLEVWEKNNACVGGVSGGISIGITTPTTNTTTTSCADQSQPTFEEEKVPVFIKRLYGLLAEEIGSLHFQVAERALHYFSNENLIAVLARFYPSIMRGVIFAGGSACSGFGGGSSSVGGGMSSSSSSLKEQTLQPESENGGGHWNRMVQAQIDNTHILLKAFDPVMYDELLSNFLALKRLPPPPKPSISTTQNKRRTINIIIKPLIGSNTSPNMMETGRVDGVDFDGTGSRGDGGR